MQRLIRFRILLVLTLLVTLPMTIEAATAGISHGSVFHLIKSDGSTRDTISVGINSAAGTLAGLFLTVTGPNGFSDSFSDTDPVPAPDGTITVTREYPENVPLAPGVYTFTLQDAEGRTSRLTANHAAIPTPLQPVDSTTIQYQRTGNGSYRISWAPAADMQPSYYRLRIDSTDENGAPAHLSPWELKPFQDIAPGTMNDGRGYKVRVESGNDRDDALLTSLSQSASVSMIPRGGDYDPRRLMIGYAQAVTRVEADGTGVTVLAFGVGSPASAATITSAVVSGPDGFTCMFQPDDRLPDGSGFSKTFPGSLPIGTYRFRVMANGIEHGAYATFTRATLLPAPLAATYRTEESANDAIRFSWTIGEHVAPLYYQVQIKDNVTGELLESEIVDQPSLVVAKEVMGDLAAKTWRVVALDSPSPAGLHNRRNGPFVAGTLSPLPFHDPVYEGDSRVTESQKAPVPLAVDKRTIGTSETDNRGSVPAASPKRFTPQATPTVTITTKPLTKPLSFKGAKKTIRFTAPLDTTIDDLRNSITSSDSWITVDTVNLKFSKGKGSLTVLVAPNGTTDIRTGSITIGSATFLVTQGATPCAITSLTITPVTPTPASGGDISLGVNVEPNSCKWKVTAYKIAPELWFSASGTFPAVDVLQTGDQTLTGTVASNGTLKARSTTISLVTADGKSKKRITLKQAKPTPNSISGTVTSGTAGLAGVTMTLSGAASATTKTTSSGTFIFSKLVSGSYTITPSKPGFTFTPASSQQTLNGQDISGVNFSAQSTQGAAIVPCPATGTTKATIQDFSFSPANLAVGAGDIVMWTNNGAFAHTVTSGTAPGSDGMFNSGVLSSGAKVCVQFTAPGTYPYFCTLHTFMTGTVTVQ